MDTIRNQKIQTKSCLGKSWKAAHVKTSDLNNVELNKYGVPTYYHFSGLLDYRFDGFFKGLDFQLLAVYKKEDRDQQIPLEYVLNRVNMVNMNLILDYRF